MESPIILHISCVEVKSCKKPCKIDSSAFFTEHSLKHLARNLARFFSLFTEAFSNNFRTLPIFFTHMNLLAVAWPVGQDLALIFYTIYIQASSAIKMRVLCYLIFFYPPVRTHLPQLGLVKGYNNLGRRQDKVGPH